ncbi:hypothetical protein FE784_39830 [Paenibacillus hemerocallicola]|uniref:Uncharacterized protein n=1 Tax=Paenibacillus hemerocallicola TaxID=1172614 RepID=A0A5C4SVT5_9BACL|nr:hypothetical protein [Paenibacillus hemerocallicola]TNJ54738.1 hypothetical protein FE784_39830 [Paenibacillus hemerocallicola]
MERRKLLAALGMTGAAVMGASLLRHESNADGATMLQSVYGPPEIIQRGGSFNHVQMNTVRQGTAANQVRYGLSIEDAVCESNVVTNNVLTPVNWLS